MNSKLENKFFYIPIIFFLITFLIRIIRIYKNFANFPHYPIVDVHSYLLTVFFLHKYGFHNIVPNLFDGFILLKNYYLGWSFFVYPIYLLIKNVLLSNYISFILAILLGFIAVYFLGKTQKYSLTKIMAFYLFFFANPLSIHMIFNIFRFGEFFAWILFIPFLTTILYYKDHKINKKFIFFFILFYSFIILSHPYIAVLASFIIIPLFLFKNFKEKIIIIFSTIFSFLITSFWWIPFFSILKKPVSGAQQLNELLFLPSLLSYNTIILVAFLFLFYLFWKNPNFSYIKKRFFIPLLILAIFILTRLIFLIPVLNKVPPNSYSLFFLIFSLYFFFEINYSKKFKKAIFIILIILSLVSTIIVFTHSYFPYQSTEDVGKNIIKLFPYIDDNYILLSNDVIADQYIIYSILNYNLSTTFTDDVLNLEASSDIIETSRKIRKGFKQKECKIIIDNLEDYNIKYVLSTLEGCKFLEKQCKLEKIKYEESACLFST